MHHLGDGPAVPSDTRVQSFITWHGEIPERAVRVEEPNARKCAASWLPGRFAKDSASDCEVIACELGERWWVLLFERTSGGAPDRAENWWVEGYSHDGGNWAANYFYWPTARRWRHFLHEFRGPDYGRHRR